jgi:Fic-DOC domain mobile mystery protein B
MIHASACGTRKLSDETQPVGATPGDDISGLLASNLATRTARNAAETDTIGRAYDKHIFRARRKKRASGWLTDEFLKTVHRDMFGSIWDWAGKYRTTRVNIGVESYFIQENIQALCGDFSYWDSSDSSMPIVEVAARLQNRLTKIHPFKNGNGRHARLLTDIFFYSREHPLPQWPQIHLMSQGHEIREQYINAMKKADQGDYSELIRFIEECLSQRG